MSSSGPPSHPPLQATASNPGLGGGPGRAGPPEEGRGWSLGRGVVPPSAPPPATPPPAQQPSHAGQQGSGRKSHARSASHGGVTFSRAGSGRERHGTDGVTAARPPLQSALKKPGHRRVFSHGQISPEQTAIPGHMQGGGGAGRAAGSRTEFILPPDHVDRDRRGSSLSIQQRAEREGRKGGSLGSHGRARRQHSRGDSLGQFWRGHSRQASRTDSIYTLRQATTNYKERIFWWQRRRGGGRGGAAQPGERKHRVVVPDHLVPPTARGQDQPNSQYLSNRIRTTKYTFLSFIPRNLFEQFHRFANLYFLFIVLLNWVPAINAFGKEISMIPVILVLFVTALKDLFEDRRRYASDKKVNNSVCRVWSQGEGEFVQRYWKELRVGDIVHLSNDEMIPADILVLHSSDPAGLCYIDTQNLDGETNLKQREVPRGLSRQGGEAGEGGGFHPGQLRASLECDAPTTKALQHCCNVSERAGSGL